MTTFGSSRQAFAKITRAIENEISFAIARFTLVKTFMLSFVQLIFIKAELRYLHKI